MYPNNEDKIPAAMYIRMSTEHQKYSPENQAAAIRENTQTTIIMKLSELIPMAAKAV